VDYPLPRRSHTDAHLGVVNLSSGSQHAACRTRALPRCDIDDASLAVRERSRARLPPNVHSYALLPICYPMGRFGLVRRVPLADVVYGDRWGQPFQGKGRFRSHPRQRCPAASEFERRTTLPTYHIFPGRGGSCRASVPGRGSPGHWRS
jgi:hypothetical protein